MNKIDRRSALGIGLAAASAVVMKPAAAQTTGSSSPLLDHTPYDIMLGTWIGTFATFDKKGNRMTAGASRYLIYWEDRPKLMHFRQDANLEERALFGVPAEEAELKTLLGDDEAPAAVRNLAIAEYDLTVDGKYATASGSGPLGRPVDVAAAETSPDVYHFEIKETGTKLRLRWYNTHIFTSPNERRTIGPVVDSNGLLGLIMVHTFTRISYDVPKEQRRKLA